jgi:hypothetical protein
LEFWPIERIQAVTGEKHIAKDGLRVSNAIRNSNSRDGSTRSNRYGGRFLISYGPAWFPSYMRRLAQRPAKLLFVVR